MTGGGGDQPPPLPAITGGDFLLSLLQKQNNQHSQNQHPYLRTGGPTPTTQQFQQPPPPPPQRQQLRSLAFDPAVAAVGPSVGSPSSAWQFNAGDLSSSSSYSPRPHSLLSTPFPSSSLGLHQYPFDQRLSNQSQDNQRLLVEDLRKLGLGADVNHAVNNVVHQQVQQQQPQQLKLQFGSFQNEKGGWLSRNLPHNLSLSSTEDNEQKYRSSVDCSPNSRSSQNSFERRSFEYREQRGRGGKGKLHHSGNQSWNYKSGTPPGFSAKQGGMGNTDFVGNSSNRGRSFDHDVDKKTGDRSGLSKIGALLHSENEKRSSGYYDNGFGLSGQLDHPGPPSGSNLHSVSASDIEESLLNSHSEVFEEGHGEKIGRDRRDHAYESNDLAELVEALLLEDETKEKNDKKQHRKSRDKEIRKDNRGGRLLSQNLRNLKKQMECRLDIHRLDAPFLDIFESLKPPEEEKAKQKQLLTLLEKLVTKEWPEARLYLYGSCANSFGVSKSDIDVCLAINDAEINKSEMLLKLADILESDNLQNVQALTRARVPIVKLMDPVTGISCDICINNVLAVVNTKLLRDYAQIDERLRQLALVVKHWAKSRGVNETYHGTLSSYAYVLMCIHFLQQRRPAILPCLQKFSSTYFMIVDDIKCAYFDQVEAFRDYGSNNKETVAQLVWGFFNYWAYRHDYVNAVISVRTGTIISKHEKDWRRRIQNDRHLICIEDPFDVSHDLGRVVDKHSIKVVKEEFERAADIMQYAPNPSVTLFEPYVSI